MQLPDPREGPHQRRDNAAEHPCPTPLVTRAELSALGIGFVHAGIPTLEEVHRAIYLDPNSCADIVNKPIDGVRGTALDSIFRMMVGHHRNGAELANAAAILIRLGADPFVRRPDGSLEFGCDRSNHCQLLNGLARWGRGVLIERYSDYERLQVFLDCYWFGSSKDWRDGTREALLGSREAPFEPPPGWLEALFKRHKLVDPGLLLDCLEIAVNANFISRSECARALNEEYGPRGRLVVHDLAAFFRHNEPQWWKTLVRLGGRFDRPTRSPHYNPGATPFHIIMDGQPPPITDSEDVRVLVAAGLTDVREKRDSKGRTPLVAFLEAGDRKITVLSELISKESLAIPNAAGRLPFDILMDAPSLRAIGLFLREGAPPPREPYARNLLEAIADLSHHLPKAIDLWRFVNLFKTLWRTSNHEAITHWFGVLEALGEQESVWWPLTPRKSLSHSSPNTWLVDLLPQLVHAFPAHAVRPIAKRIENYCDRRIRPARFHQNQSELLMLCAHPGLQQERPGEGSTWEALSKAITAPYRFYWDSKWKANDAIEDVSDEVFHFWARTGKATFGFFKLKHDARKFRRADGQWTTLLEEGGLEKLKVNKLEPFSPWTILLGSEHASAFRIAGAETGSDPAGKGWSDLLDPGEEFELARTHLRIYRRGGVEVVIRNSSPDGGRAVLRYPAYVLTASRRQQLVPDGKGLQRSWSAREIEKHFTPIFERKFYPGGELGPTLSEVDNLIGRFERWYTAYRGSYFGLWGDYAGIEDPMTGKKFLVGAYRSPRFRTLVNALAYWESCGESNELAVDSLTYPGWVAHCTLAATRPTIRGLERLADLDFESPAVRNSGVLDFVQQAIDSQGEFTIRTVEK